MVQTLRLAEIGALDRIGQGGQGIVYRAPAARTAFAKEMVYKEYKPAVLATLDFDALEALPDFLEALPYRDGAHLIGIAAWPCAVVESAGNITGFLMPAIPDEFFTDIWTVRAKPSKVLAEFQHLLNDPHVLAMRFKGAVITDRDRYQLLRQMASALSFLHERGVCVGDISPKNVLYSLDPTPAIYFIDCDAMRVRGRSLSAQVETPGWSVPQGEERATVFSDRYKLGLLALRLLLGNQDAKDPSLLPPSVPIGLRDVIAATLSNQPRDRPELAEWDVELARAIAAAPKTPINIVSVIAPPMPASVVPAPANKRQYQQQKFNPGAGTMSKPASSAPVKASSPPVWLLLAVALLGVIGVGSLFARQGNNSGTSSVQTVTATATAISTIAAPAVTKTVAPTQNRSEPPAPQKPPRGSDDLGLAVPMVNPPCDGRGIVILSSVTTPGEYATGVSAALARFPGSSYLRTDLTCPSLKARDEEGDPIYAVYRFGGWTREQLCSAVALAGNGAYGKVLDYTTDPSYIVCRS